MIKTTKNYEEATVITHGGYFHADEVFASVILSYTTIPLIVARVMQVPENCEKLVYDIGGGKYDHHQKEKEYRSDGIPYAAAGLIWRDYGKRALRKRGVEEELLSEAWARIDQSLIRGIDASDNGISMNADYSILAVDSIIGMFNPFWDECKDTDESFLEACALADQILKRAIDSAVSEVRGEGLIKEAMGRADGRTIRLEKYVPWQKCVCAEDPDNRFWYIVYPSNRGGYNVQCVPDYPDSFNMRHGLPEEWRGLRDEQLRRVTGVKDAVFVHPTGFIGGAESMEGALLMAEKAAQSK